MGKTETINQRTVCVYVPTLEQKNQWNEIAQKNNTSLSQWIIQTIEDSLIEIEDEVKSKKGIEKENENLRKEISELQNKLRQITTIRENLEREIRKYRSEPFLNTSFNGELSYDKELIDILRNAKGVDGKIRYLDNDEILSRLGVKLSDTESVKVISIQLSRLENYGLVESNTKGWRWKE